MLSAIMEKQQMPNIMKKTLLPKKLAKTDREQAVLFGLIDLYLKSGKAIGSHTLQENGFESLSSATIRNYFSKMEEAGLLAQQHTSGGRIPTAAAFRAYADHYEQQGVIEKEQEEALYTATKMAGKEVATMLQKGADVLSELTKCAVFVSAPRFDQDFIQNVKLVPLDAGKLLSVLITDFGLIRTETLLLEKELDNEFLRTVEEYFFWRLNKGEKPFFKNEEDGRVAQKIYNEIMVRHVVGYGNFPEEDVIRTGLSKLLSYPEFSDAASLSGGLALLEDGSQMRALLRDAAKKDNLSCWIGDELSPFIAKDSECSVIAIPYKINQIVAGSVALLGPMRLPYRNLFGIIQAYSQALSEALTESVYKYKITFRQPTRLNAGLDGRQEAKYIEV